MRIGILGGTFNPIHNTHIEIAIAAKSQYSLDEVWFVVSGMPPHKENDNSISRYHRLKMCEIALEGEDGLVVKSDELLRPGKCYTYETIEYYKENYPNNDYYFIMGGDSLLNFHTWKNPQRIIKCCNLLVAARGYEDSCDINEVKNYAKDFSKQHNIEVGIISISPTKISSTNIREYLYHKDYKKCDKLINSKVLLFINTHRLYEKEETYDIKFIIDSLKDNLNEKRFLHSLSVADTAGALAAAYLYPTVTAYVAGLLHDCAKYLSTEELLSYISNNDLEISDDELKYIGVLHAPVGAHMASKKYGICDSEIIDAISTHTTGNANMSLLQEILYIADYIEPRRRRSKILSYLRYTAFYDKDLCIYMIANDTVEYLKEKGLEIDKKSLDTLNYYDKKVRERRLL